MIVAPVDNLIVTVEKKHQDIVNGFYVDTRFNPEEHVTVLGTVVSVPRGISNRFDHIGYTIAGIEAGDTVIMRYDVIHHFAKQKEDENTVYKYEIFYKGKSYWRADIIKIFGYIRDGEIRMINGYVMLDEPVEEASKIIIPNLLKAIPRTARAMISHIGGSLTHLPPTNAKAGDIAFFDNKKAQRYQVNGKKILIIKQPQILGIEAADTSS